MYSRFHFPLCVAAFWGAAFAMASAEGLPASFTAECDPSGAELARFDMNAGDAQRAYESSVEGYVRAQALLKRRGAMAAQARAKA